jgi:hypothetical protein
VDTRRKKYDDIERFLVLLIAGLVSLYPINKIVKYRDRKKGRD